MSCTEVGHEDIGMHGWREPVEINEERLESAQDEAYEEILPEMLDILTRLQNSRDAYLKAVRAHYNNEDEPYEIEEREDADDYGGDAYKLLEDAYRALEG